ncbi:MAG: DUF4445 domain-containing protein [Chloroflexi bacterium]|nr:DUF4445 domain-containing protein [Chloroflexota bacterium]
MSPLHFGKQQLESIRGKSIFDHADQLHVKVPTSCGRTGTCHECIVEIVRGMEALSPPSEAEHFLRDNYRLACQARVLDPDADVEFSLMQRQRQIMTRGLRRAVELDPLTRRVGDDDVYFGDRRIDTYRGAIYGLAVDVGTTTVVMNLCDLETGAILFTSSLDNPQRFGGSDVMHRISYDSDEFHGEMHLAITNAVNSEIRQMCRELRFSRRLIYELVVVGNATMRDLFFGLDVKTIGEKPYKSLTEFALLRGERTTTALYTSPGELGIRINPAGTVYGGPLIASHVGADVAADLVAIGIDEVGDDETVMLVDIGTNTEVIVGNGRHMLAASCPAGPAFEGGYIAYGMSGFTGAIETIRIANGHVDYKVIGDAEPEGICGSGLIDLLAELVRTQHMNDLGVLDHGSPHFTIVPEKGITISRADISQLAQAKGANYCGAWIVLRSSGVPPRRVKRLYLAGGFANYIDVPNAISIGFVPNLPLEKIVKVGNASLEGATIMLLSREKRDLVEQLVRRATHIELEMEPDFFDLFVDGCIFKPMDLSLLEREEIAR